MSGHMCIRLFAYIVLADGASTGSSVGGKTSNPKMSGHFRITGFSQGGIPETGILLIRKCPDIFGLVV